MIAAWNRFNFVPGREEKVLQYSNSPPMWQKLFHNVTLLKLLLWNCLFVLVFINFHALVVCANLQPAWEVYFYVFHFIDWHNGDWSFQEATSGQGFLRGLHVGDLSSLKALPDSEPATVQGKAGCIWSCSNEDFDQGQRGSRSKRTLKGIMGLFIPPVQVPFLRCQTSVTQWNRWAGNSGLGSVSNWARNPLERKKRKILNTRMKKEKQTVWHVL